jgi:NAD-dependent DNA ligase
LVLVKDQLFCKNSQECPAQNNKTLQHYCKVLKIKGFGPKTIEKLNVSTIRDMYDLTEEFLTDTLGRATGEKLYKEVQNATSLEIAPFIQALSIPLVGSSAARKLGNTFDLFSGFSKQDLMDKGLGDKASDNFIEYFNVNEDMLRALPISFSVTEDTIIERSEGCLVFCITGKIIGMSKAQATDVIEKAGHEVKSSFSSKVTHVICDNKDSTSSTVVKAKNSNVPILSWTETLDLLSK